MSKTNLISVNSVNQQTKSHEVPKEDEGLQFNSSSTKGHYKNMILLK